jgi:sporulation protein YlmC with PRC-barrel domain
MRTRATVRLERLLGRRLVDAAGREVGCIEDVVAEPTGDEYVVTHAVIGSSSRLARVLSFAHQIPTLAALGLGRPLRIRRIPWTWLDLSDPTHPRLVPSVVDRD